jgi:hypothetical protein
MSTETTTVEITDIDIDNLLNPGGASVLLPTNENEPPKNNLFSRKPEDVSFLNKPFEKDPPPAPAAKEDLDENGNPKKPVEAAVTPVELDNIVNETVEDENNKNNPGRPKVDKQGLIELATKLIDKKILVPFDDDKPLDKYTLTDFEELFEANANERERKIREEVPGEFYQSLPPELQYAAKYAADGGTDFRGLFRTLAAVEEVKNLNPAEATDQRSIVRSYLQATNFGTPDDIEEEINGWDDRGELEAKANKFKPKLDALSERQVQYQLQQQEHLRRQQTEQAQMYMDNVYKTLEPGTLNDLPLDKKTQNLLFAGLVQPNYPSVSGKQTNLLGHLLEKYQFVEPNHGLVAEALWLLADPEGYRAKVRTATKKEVVTETVRKLKSEEGKRLPSHVESEDQNNNNGKGKGIPRPSQNFFKR